MHPFVDSPKAQKAMRGRGRASPVLSGLETRAEIVLADSGYDSFGLLRDATVVLHGHSPQWRWMVELTTPGLAPDSGVA